MADANVDRAPEFTWESSDLETWKRYVLASWEDRWPVVVWTKPGNKNTAIIRELAGRMRAEYIAVNVRGLPPGNIDASLAQVLPPPNSARRYVIDLVNLPHASPFVQAEVYRLLVQRRASFPLHEELSVVACTTGLRKEDWDAQVAVYPLNKFLPYSSVN